MRLQSIHSTEVVTLLSSVGLLSFAVPVQAAPITPLKVSSTTSANVGVPYPRPPQGFDPLTASTSQLKKYGIPLPPPTSDVSALAAWRTAMSKVTSFITSTQIVAPHPIAPPAAIPTSGSTFSGSSSGTEVGQTSGWAGYALAANNNLGTPYEDSYAQWTVPGLSGNGDFPDNTWNTTAPGISFWTGTGGDNPSATVQPLIQAGTLSVNTATPQYRFWYEDYPSAAVFAGPTIRAGDTLYVSVATNSSFNTDFYLENVTTGVAQSFSLATSNWAGGSADFMAELYHSTVPQFSQDQIFNGVTSEDGNSKTMGSQNATQFVMKLNGTTLVQPGPMEPDTNSFTETWENNS